MAPLRDIPDDAPENIAKSILLIIEEVAYELGAVCKRDIKHNGIAKTITFDVQLGSNQFRMVICYADSGRLDQTSGTIGNGLLTAGREFWDLELLPEDITCEPPSPPFRWGLYKPGSDVVSEPPSHVLSADLLRRLLRDSLSPPPCPSP